MKTSFTKWKSYESAGKYKAWKEARLPFSQEVRNAFMRDFQLVPAESEVDLCSIYHPSKKEKVNLRYCKKIKKTERVRMAQLVPPPKS
ncbi:hypothetical protein SAMN05216244_1052 [Sediminibacillus halophilus]|uniref:Uncharacterized protein n=1 Tax=Sediminibacillus halophilus TaxID=482461 RepID=A0A1G9NLD5_9BACI|nr:hypothetical protein SAMN05216244_1052 [Sediminibacillus halophilus]